MKLPSEQTLLRKRGGHGGESRRRGQTASRHEWSVAARRSSKNRPPQQQQCRQASPTRRPFQCHGRTTTIHLRSDVFNDGSQISFLESGSGASGRLHRGCRFFSTKSSLKNIGSCQKQQVHVHIRAHSLGVLNFWIATKPVEQKEKVGDHGWSSQALQQGLQTSKIQK